MFNWVNYQGVRQWIIHIEVPRLWIISEGQSYVYAYRIANNMHIPEKLPAKKYF
jgi:hypothetical protein